jgi:hypothetical protein
MQPAVPTGCIFRKFNKLFIANNRQPAEFYSAGHHQQPVL